MFQEATKAVQMIEELEAIFGGETENEEEFRFFHRMRQKNEEG